MIFYFISSPFFEVPITARNRACAPYLRNRELRPASGSPGEGDAEAVFFFLIPFLLNPTGF